MSAVQCPSCSDTVLETQFFCPRCGTSLDAPETPTGTAPRPVRTPGAAERTPARGSASRQVPPAGRVVSGGRPGSGASSVGRVVASKPSDERFSAGDLLLDRYRVIGLLGRGGMGEVYRADDLKLGQPVAIKFLPSELAANPQAVSADELDKTLIEGLDAKRLRYYVCDFPAPALLGKSNVVALPHLGASTREAEDNCAVMVVDQVRDFLENGNILNAVNFPDVSMQRESPFRIAIANAGLPLPGFTHTRAMAFLRLPVA